MKGSLNYIISTDTPYLNTVSVGDKELIINTEITERDAQFVNRVGQIIGTPIFEDTLGLKKGDLVIVHHNVFRVYYDMRQVLRRSANYIEDELYYADADQMFAKKSPGGDWEALEGFSFIKPIPNTNQWDPSPEEPLKGELYFKGKGSEELGLTKGDIVGFTPNSEYEFVIDGIKLYRVYTNHINILYHGKEERSLTNNSLV